MMYLLLVGIIKQYVEGLLSNMEFEDWIVGHMQDILDSSDQRAIELAETIDALLIERQERLFTEEELRLRLTSLIHEPFVITGTSNPTTFHQHAFTQVHHWPITWTPESAAADR